ncbi:MAG: transposase [Pseudomonadales bacterium]
MTRRKYYREFKIEVVRLVTDLGAAVAQAARDFGLTEGVLRRKMRNLAATPATGGKRHLLLRVSATPSLTR